MNFFPVVKSISPVAKTFTHRMRSFIIFLCLHCTMVTVRLQCMMKIALFPRFSSSLLITYLITFSLEKWIHVLEKSLKKVLKLICLNSDQDNVKHDKCVILSEIVNFSNVFQHMMYYYSVWLVLLFFFRVANVMMLLQMRHV